MSVRRSKSAMQAMEIIFRTDKSDAQGNTAHYAVGPLARGYGMTIGNTLRRVLLSSLPGAAVTAIRVAGLQSKDQRIDHVAEDLAEIVLNVKQLRLRSFSDDRVFMRLDVRGKREVTAADLVVLPIVEIVNPALHLATLTDETAHLNMELVVETGRGYVPADAREVSAGILPLDAIYTPVLDVKMQVEKTRVGQMTNYDLLHLTITTDGTITSDEAFRHSAAILVRCLTVFADGETSGSERQTLLPRAPIPWEIDRLPLEALELSTRSSHALKRRNLRTVGQVLSLDEVELLSIRNFGDRSLLELYERLHERHLLPALLDEKNT